jgi:hypothetical protein
VTRGHKWVSINLAINWKVEECSICGLMRDHIWSEKWFFYIGDTYLDKEPACNEIVMRKALR